MKLIKLSILIICFLASCKKENSKKTTEQKTASTYKTVLKYAKGFEVKTENGITKLIIHKPYQTATEADIYTLNETESSNNINTPIKNVVVTSTTHIPMLELLGVDNTLTGFPNTQFISSEKTRKRIDNKEVIELGNEREINVEKLLELNPDLVIGFGVNGNNKSYKTIKKSGINVVYNGDWLEESPLGRAEWIKFFGVLYNKEKEADSIFNTIEKDYLAAKKLALQAKKQPSIMSGTLFKDIWYVPAGESFIATYFNDANTNYLWKDTKGTGSLNLNLENVLEKAQDANIWIGSGIFDKKEDLLSSNKHYEQFKPFKTDSIFTYAKKKGKTGGMLYFERSPVEPHIVLKDIIKIAHPELLPNYQPYFIEKL